jgi:hypothetical protein
LFLESNESNTQQPYSKELWIFWFEKEEPPNLRSLISNDLQPDQSSNASCPTTGTTSSANSKDILANASSSHNGLPYECRSMLFKALHNLIERSLLAKGYARLGKWFVMPYNLNSVNYSYNSQFNIDTRASHHSHHHEPQHSSRNATKSLYSNTNNFYKLGIDDSNHVSYMFNFFLHGASRVCTSVDMKMHKPIRVLSQFDLLKLKNEMKLKLRISRHQSSNSESKPNNEVPFKGLKCILAPYGISARLLGYVADDSVEAKVTVREWEQFYPSKLVPHVPHVFVVGVGDANKVKLFYPNCFIYVIMDGADDLSDDELNYDHLDVDNYDLYDAALLSDSSLNSLNSREW